MSAAASRFAALFNSKPPDNDTQRATLARELRLAKGFTLIFVVCNSAEERRRQIDALSRDLPDLHIQELPVRRKIPHLRDVLRATLEEPLPDAVFIYGMENWIRNDEDPRSVPFILNLNAARNHFYTDCPCPFVLWMPEFLLALIAAGAPDFASIRNGLYVFTPSPTEEKEAILATQRLEWTELTGLSLPQKQQRLKELEEMLLRVQNLPKDRRNPQDEASLLNELAETHYAMARYSEAEPLYERALAIREKVLGAEHPDTAQSLNNLAVLYYNQGRYAEAEPLYVRALAIAEKVLGAEHPDTASSLNNLAALYNNQGRYANAEPLYVRALAIREKVLGAEHPDTASSLNNLALLYDNQGRYAEAEPLYVRALAIREKVLGAEHPDTAQSLNNLAFLYDNQGRYAEAEPLYVRALAIAEKVLGAEHPNTQIYRRNLERLQQKRKQK